MADGEATSEAEFVADGVSNASAAFAALSALFAECLSDVWTPLSGDQRHLLAHRFDETLAHYLPQLDASSFGSFAFLMIWIRSLSGSKDYLLWAKGV